MLKLISSSNTSKVFKNMTYKFTTIIQQDGKWFVARCVELGVVSQNNKNISTNP